MANITKLIIDGKYVLVPSGGGGGEDACDKKKIIANPQCIEA